jgi:hypothetical protein
MIGFVEYSFVKHGCKFLLFLIFCDQAIPEYIAKQFRSPANELHKNVAAGEV